MPIAKTCEQCAANFFVKPSHAKQRFCSKLCVTAYEATHGRTAAHAAETEFFCRECSKPFFYKPAYLTEYRKKFNKDPMYCSRECSALGRRKTSDEKHKAECKNCGKEFYKTRRKGSGTIYREQALCSKQCKAEWTSKQYREKHGIPQISRRVKRGYVVLRIPARDGNPPYEILEHRYVMEQKLGRPLHKNETVHHKFGNRQDNDPAKLELWSKNHGPGQRVTDQVQFAIEILTLYPEFASSAGYELRKLDHISDDPRAFPTT
jgi:hypothetical protein